MNNKNKIGFLVGIVVIIVLAMQMIRYDNFVVKNFKNENAAISELLSSNEKIEEVFDTDDSFLLIYDSSSDSSVRIFENCKNVFKYQKKDYRVVDVKKPKPVSISEKTVLIMVEEIPKIQNFHEIAKFMENGGRVGILQTVDGFTDYRSFGIREYGNPTNLNSIKFDERFMPAYKDDFIEMELVSNFSNLLSLEDNCEVYIEDKNGVPILWTLDAGEGRGLIFNGSMLESRIMIGFITRCISLLDETYIYPVINSKVIWLDDFPSPMSNTYYPDIKKEYNKTIKEFYIDVWWPKVLSLARKFNVTYTGALIQTYNDRVTKPFSPAVGEIGDTEFVIMSRELIRSGGELGIHGYNHQSLTLESWKSKRLHYNEWKSIDNMIAALAEVKLKIKKAFPNYEVNSYVPPSNVLDENGIKAIKTVFPNLNVIASVYNGDSEGLSYAQEFDYNEKWDVVNLPRFSSGYNFGMNNRICIFNGILAFGAIQHFIHPDDFMDPRRNEGKTWIEQMKSLEEFFEFAYKDYPFIESQTASQAAKNVINYDRLDYITDYGEDGIRVKSNAKLFPMYMFLSSKKDVVAGENCTVHKYADKEYFVVFTDKYFSLKYKKVN